MASTCIVGLPVLARPAAAKASRQQFSASKPVKALSRQQRAVRVHATSTPVPEPPPEPTKKSFNDLMGFGGLGPELVNGRAAMMAFVGAAAAEHSTHETVAQQFSDSPAAVVGFVALITLATFAPHIRGGDMDPQNGWEALKKSTFTNPAAIEQWNGRAAMIGLVALLVIERSGSAFF